ncbi:MAG TPA: sigma 54-interacting transcriptional regulator [Polyangia bacterium]|nr:sigma 54-interacting transcriptional regulator [Polyangia bacterium]
MTTVAEGVATALRLRRCRLEVMGGHDAGLTREFTAETIRVGARRENDLVLLDAKVSGLHCEIRLDEHGYRLRDLGSKNGTFVGGMRVVDVYVNPGVVLEVGDTRLRFDPLPGSVEVPLARTDDFFGLVGRSVKMRELFARLEKIGPSEATVLITGETGTGKELVAEAIHKSSPRAGGPFVVVDAGAIPRTLVESELFGFERGAFTGADRASAGAFERAHGGTIFLDEIGELPLDLQPKLLRALERKEVKRLGAQSPVRSDVRVIAATHRDLAVEVNRNTFREDLYYRLAVARLHLPPLRERREDIPQLIEYFFRQMGEGHQRLQPETIELLCRQPWPGNVRELRNAIERAVVLAEAPGESSVVRAREAAPGQSGSGSDDPSLSLPIDLEAPFKEAKAQLVEAFERRYLSELLRRTGGNISRAARRAGLDRMSVHKMIVRLGIPNPRD